MNFGMAVEILGDRPYCHQHVGWLCWQWYWSLCLKTDWCRAGCTRHTVLMEHQQHQYHT